MKSQGAGDGFDWNPRSEHPQRTTMRTERRSHGEKSLLKQGLFLIAAIGQGPYFPITEVSN